MASLFGLVCPHNWLGLPTPRCIASFMAILNKTTHCNGLESTSQPPSMARQKVTGRAFYESLGSPKMIMAPMVDQSEFVCFL